MFEKLVKAYLFCFLSLQTENLLNFKTYFVLLGSDESLIPHHENK
jgi:hypothetical protein